MQFDLLRLGLLERPINLFEAAGIERRPSREEWLRDLFNRSIVFVHRTEEFHYVPDPSMPPESAVIIGRIGRRTAVPDHEPPAKGLADTKRDAWAAVRIVIDPRHHTDGQKLAVQHDRKVGAPLALVSSLANELNVHPYPYEIELSPIVNADTFWGFVDTHKGKITSVSFEFISPNMFGEKDDYDREMKELRDREKARKAKLELENRDGLELQTPRVQRAVDYISPGQGRIRAKTKDGHTFKSEDKIKRVGIPNKEAKRMSTEQLLVELARRILST